MKAGTDNHIKFRKLKRLLNVPMYVACGILESLWLFAGQHADDGYIGRHSNEDICDWIEYDGDPDQLVDALVQSRWLDRRHDGTVEIHDWLDHAPTYIKDRWRKRGDSGKFREIPGSSRNGHGGSQGTDVEVPVENPGPSETFQDNRTNSIQFNPNQAKPNPQTTEIPPSPKPKTPEHFHQHIVSGAADGLLDAMGKTRGTPIKATLTLRIAAAAILDEFSHADTIKAWAALLSQGEWEQDNNHATPVDFLKSIKVAKWLDVANANGKPPPRQKSAAKSYTDKLRREMREREQVLEEERQRNAAKQQNPS